MGRNFFYGFLTWSFIIFSAPGSLFCQSGKENISEGSYIINMGVIPQTHSNALKSYGMLYELLNSQSMEVKWVINSEKEKDGIDFSMDERDFRGSAFIIPQSYLTQDVREIIRRWEKKGVKGAWVNSRLYLPVFTSLSVAPKWTLDKENGLIAVPFFRAAGIPESAHGGRYTKNWKDPSELGICDDIFVMPHADPQFESHKNLFVWNRDYKGAIWAGCHAVSKMENLSGKIKDTDDRTEELIQLNFLSAGFPGARSAGLLHYRTHTHAFPPYKSLLPADPVSQYLGQPDKAHFNGSERVFLPKAVNEWRPETKKILIDPDAPDIPSKSKGEAAIIIYGHAFDDPNRGLVMYQAGHSIYGKTEAHVAAMRAFFNWSFYATEVKRKANLIKFENLDSGGPVIGAKIGDDLAKVLNLRNIHFDLDKDEIRKDALEELDKIVGFMKKYPELLINIRSHTDSRANDTYNLELSERRVNSTRAYLVEKGVEADRISGRGYGETQLLNECDNNMPCPDSRHELNRRSEFILSINCKLYSGEQQYASPD